MREIPDILYSNASEICKLDLYLPDDKTQTVKRPTPASSPPALLGADRPFLIVS